MTDTAAADAAETTFESIYSANGQVLNRMRIGGKYTASALSGAHLVLRLGTNSKPLFFNGKRRGEISVWRGYKKDKKWKK